jgi:2Fe-2S ferredoxin
MPRVTLIEHDGTSHVLTADVGVSVMQAAVNNDVPGILAECGGAAACATCRVIVPEDWAGRLVPPAALEASMLDDEDTPNLRLSCQIKVTDAIDGLVVHIPSKQR